MWSNSTNANAAARHGFPVVPKHQECAPLAKPPTGTHPERKEKLMKLLNGFDEIRLLLRDRKIVSMTHPAVY